MSVSEQEIVPGLVVQLDTATVRALGGAQTNAELSGSADRAVLGTVDFLVVGVDLSRTTCTAVPLFAKSAVGNQPLDASKKSGGDASWTATEHWFSRWQHWRIPLAHVEAASAGEATEPLGRRRYAAADRSALDDIKNWEIRNRAPYRSA
ncbi:MAG: hypothetical protein IT353_01245 [Gemmatimonadaceae bacterium]|nr:hypothetical protein [Gemmatimonadaceae bacterium]